MNQPNYKKPPRALTHKVVSVTNEDHLRLRQWRHTMSMDLGRDATFDDVVTMLLDRAGEPRSSK